MKTMSVIMGTVMAVMMMTSMVGAYEVQIDAGTGNGETETVRIGTGMPGTMISTMDRISMDATGAMINMEMSRDRITTMTTDHAKMSRINGHVHMNNVHTNNGENTHAIGIHHITVDGDVTSYTLNGVQAA